MPDFSHLQNEDSNNIYLRGLWNRLNELNIKRLKKSSTYFKCCFKKYLFIYLVGFPRWLREKESPCDAGDLGLVPGSGRSPGGGWQPTPVFLPGKSHGQRSLAACSPWGRKELDPT